jgi:hypothetical protein
VSFSNWELIDDYAGLRKYIRSSGEDEGTVQVKYEQDVQPHIDRNKAAQAAWDGKFGDEPMHHAASIPAVIAYEWLTKFGVNVWNPDHMPAVAKLLNSGDYRYLKTKDIII